MASKTEIGNLALVHVGVARRIGNIDTERSTEAGVINSVWDICVAATLRDFPWAFANRITSLGLVSQNPNLEWGFAYTYPADCVSFHRILSGIAMDSHQTRVPFKIANGDSSTLIYSNKDSAQGEYTVLVTDVSRFTPDYSLALAYRIGDYIAPAVTGGDPFKLGDKCAQLYLAEISRAKANAGNEEQPRREPESEFTRTRNDGYDSFNHCWEGSGYEP